MKRRNILLLFLFVLCTACGSLPKVKAEPIPITVEDAIERGFPIYVPTNDTLQSMGITSSPTITLNAQDRSCTYLSIDLPYENIAQDNEKPALKMLVSDGCVYPAWQGYETELSWAVGGKATRVGDDFVDKLPPVILFQEPMQKFQYVVFSEESFENTMRLLEAMRLRLTE